MSQYRTLRDAVWACAVGTIPKIVALRLVEHWPRIMPSLASLCEFTGLSERAVRDALRELEERKVIETRHRPGQRSEYTFVGVSIPALGTPAPAAAPPRHVAPDTPARGAGPTPARGAPEADKDSSSQRSRQGEAGSRALMPHEVAERRQAQETTPGARPVVRFEFRPDWKPKLSHRELGLSLGLTDDDIGARLHDCRNKVYEKGFTSEDKQFNRELAWAARDKETAAFKLQQRKASNVRDFEQPGHRRSGG